MPTLHLLDALRLFIRIQQMERLRFGIECQMELQHFLLPLWQGDTEVLVLMELASIV